MRILIAEDSDLMAAFLGKLLRDAGHQTVVASDGAKALRWYEREPFDVVLTDWEMPHLDGPGLCRRIREIPRREYTYVILQTIRAGREDLLAALDAGADDFLSKPVDAELLFARLKVADRILRLQGEVRRLRDLVPICAYCKRVRDDQNYWTEVETYLGEATGSQFTHGVCPDCRTAFLKQQP